MADIPGQKNTAPAFSNLAPPPPEVKLRTMKSDLESVARSGGGLPQYQNIKAPNLANLSNTEKRYQPQAPQAPAREIPWSTIGAILVALALLGGIVYLAYQIFFQK